MKLPYAITIAIYIYIYNFGKSLNSGNMQQATGDHTIVSKVLQDYPSTLYKYLSRHILCLIFTSHIWLAHQVKISNVRVKKHGYRTCLHLILDSDIFFLELFLFHFSPHYNVSPTLSWMYLFLPMAVFQYWLFLVLPCSILNCVHILMYLSILLMEDRYLMYAHNFLLIYIYNNMDNIELLWNNSKDILLVRILWHIIIFVSPWSEKYSKGRSIF